MNFKDRLKSVLGEKSMRNSELARRAGTSRSTVSNWFNCGSKPNSENLEEVARVLGVRSKWLLKGEGPKKAATEVNFSERKDGFYTISVVKIRFSEGARKFSIVPIGDRMTTISLPAELYQGNNYDLDKLIAITVDGPAMEPSLFDGDWVVINTADITPKDGVAFAVHEEGEVVIRRLFKVNNQWITSPDNLDKRIYREKPMTKENVILGRVVHRQTNHI